VSQPSLESELDALLSEPIESVRRREATAFDELASPFEKSLVLFGAGGLGRKTLAGLRRLGVEPLAFADNNPALWGKEVDGMQVLAVPTAAELYAHRAAFIITIWRGEGSDTMTERRQQLARLNCPRIVPFGLLYWKYPEEFLPHYAVDLPSKVYQQAEKVRAALGLWADQPSRREFLAQVRWRTFMDFDCLPRPVSHEIYFPADLTTLMPHEVFIDCGAFDGDTIRRFLHVGGGSADRIVAYEPDPVNFRRLQEFKSGLSLDLQHRLILHASAVGAKKGKVHFESSGTEASSVGSGDLEVDCVTLDESLADLKASYVKMDIEGSELDALVGSENTIRRHLPIVAACAYHRQHHLWDIPLCVRSLSSDYHFFLRPHLLEVWDLVCYAIPSSRLSIPPG
jgi:FkbM family methyltransferase